MMAMGDQEERIKTGQADGFIKEVARELGSVEEQDFDAMK